MVLCAKIVPAGFLIRILRISMSKWTILDKKKKKRECAPKFSQRWSKGDIVFRCPHSSPLNFPGGARGLGGAPLKGMPAFKAPGFLCEGRQMRPRDGHPENLCHRWTCAGKPSEPFPFFSFLSEIVHLLVKLKYARAAGVPVDSLVDDNLEVD